MKLGKFIKENCCNYVRNECVGVWIGGRFNDTTKCWPLMKEDPEPCNMFEKVVLPWAIKLGYHDELVDQYAQIDFGVVKRTKESKKTRSKAKKTK